jgi:hypothetical protein
MTMRRVVGVVLLCLVAVVTRADQIHLRPWARSAAAVAGTPPDMTIHTPSTAPSDPVSSVPVVVAGTASDDGTIVSVTASCPTATPTSPTVSGLGNWSFTVTGLAAGSNVCTVTATDNDTQTVQRTKTLIYTAPDTTAPVIVISGSNPDTVATSTYTFQGTCTDDVLADYVAWSNSRGGAGTAIINDLSNWIAPDVTLFDGANILTATCYDAAGNSDADTKTVNKIADLTISTASAGSCTVGTAKSLTFSASGGVPPYTWVRLSGDMFPDGLSFSTPTLSGTPTTVQTRTFTMQVTDAQGTPDTDTQQYTLNCLAAGTETPTKYYEDLSALTLCTSVSSTECRHSSYNLRDNAVVQSRMETGGKIAILSSSAASPAVITARTAIRTIVSSTPYGAVTRIRTVEAHNFLDGSTVYMTGMSVSALNDAGGFTLSLVEGGDCKPDPCGRIFTVPVDTTASGVGTGTSTYALADHKLMPLIKTTIEDHAGCLAVNGTHVVTIVDDYRFSIPVNCTGGAGTGGTSQGWYWEYDTARDTHPDKQDGVRMWMPKQQANLYRQLRFPINVTPSGTAGTPGGSPSVMVTWDGYWTSDFLTGPPAGVRHKNFNYTRSSAYYELRTEFSSAVDKPIVSIAASNDTVTMGACQYFYAGDVVAISGTSVGALNTTHTVASDTDVANCTLVVLTTNVTTDSTGGQIENPLDVALTTVRFYDNTSICSLNAVGIRTNEPVLSGVQGGTGNGGTCAANPSVPLGSLGQNALRNPDNSAGFPIRVGTKTRYWLVQKLNVLGSDALFDWWNTNIMLGGVIGRSTITSCTAVATTVCTHAGNLNYDNNNILEITGNSNSSINGTKTITVLSPTTFSIAGTDGLGGTGGTTTKYYTWLSGWMADEVRGPTRILYGVPWEYTAGAKVDQLWFEFLTSSTLLWNNDVAWYGYHFVALQNYTVDDAGCPSACSDTFLFRKPVR